MKSVMCVICALLYCVSTVCATVTCNDNDVSCVNHGVDGLCYDSSSVPYTFERDRLWGEFVCRATTKNCDCAFKKPVRNDNLFGSLEFRSRSNTFPEWLHVITSVSADNDAYYMYDTQTEVCSVTDQRWQMVLKQSLSQDGLEQLKTVNSFFNRWPYRPDIDAYGVSDYWASPDEFLMFSGDCEDYSIVKYYALRELGYTPDDLRIVLLKDKIRNVSHAVLTVKLNGEIYVLDNLSNLVLSHLNYEQYVPRSSVNECYQWAHVTPDVFP